MGIYDFFINFRTYPPPSGLGSDPQIPLKIIWELPKYSP